MFNPISWIFKLFKKPKKQTESKYNFIHFSQNPIIDIPLRINETTRGNLLAHAYRNRFQKLDDIKALLKKNNKILGHSFITFQVIIDKGSNIDDLMYFISDFESARFEFSNGNLWFTSSINGIKNYLLRAGDHTTPLIRNFKSKLSKFLDSELFIDIEEFEVIDPARKNGSSIDESIKITKVSSYIEILYYQPVNTRELDGYKSMSISPITIHLADTKSKFIDYLSKYAVCVDININKDRVEEAFMSFYFTDLFTALEHPMFLNDEDFMELKSFLNKWNLSENLQDRRAQAYKVDQDVDEEIESKSEEYEAPSIMGMGDDQVEKLVELAGEEVQLDLTQFQEDPEEDFNPEDYDV